MINKRRDKRRCVGHRTLISTKCFYTFLSTQFLTVFYIAPHKFSPAKVS